ncbi:NUDIX domain-containing protein [Devosia lucknowensis]|uniref:NUDIX domain-containing protein n=1 Tax=Devosia lucknowensis TaxID=1096929 RepID=A0A1Y6EBY0_9HYPH|nr:NUDIX domain-containing protein [Devosia lucknowensis]SMQ60064.1 NUDIX domain-containing protein [Devosia lucknowensis]
MTAPPNAASVGIVKHGKILLIKRAFAPYQNLWTFPGGRMEPNETIEQCAIREVQEELGLTVRNPRHAITQELGRDGTYRLAVFTTTDYVGTIRPSNEVTDFKWADPGMLLALRTTSRLDDVIRECFKVLGQSW